MMDVDIEFSGGIAAGAGDDVIASSWGLCSHWVDSGFAWNMNGETRYVCGEDGATCRVVLYKGEPEDGPPVVYDLDWYRPDRQGLGNVIVVRAELGDSVASTVQDRGKCYHSTLLLEPASLWDTFLRENGLKREAFTDVVRSTGELVMLGKKLVLETSSSVVVRGARFGWGDACRARVVKGTMRDASKAWIGISECFDVDDGSGAGEVTMLVEQNGGAGRFFVLDTRSYDFMLEHGASRWEESAMRHVVFKSDVERGVVLDRCAALAFSGGGRGEAEDLIASCATTGGGRRMTLEEMLRSVNEWQRGKTVVYSYMNEDGSREIHYYNDADRE